MSRTRIFAACIAVGLIAAVLLLPFLPPVRTAALTAMLVPELMDLPLRPLSEGVPEPARETVTYGSPADRMDVYFPSGAHLGSRLPAVVLAFGVHPQPIDSPGVVQIAEAISRLGVVVGVPDSTALRNLQITPAEPAHLADAVLSLSHRPEVDPERVGLAGFSAGASMALIAGADPRISQDLAYVSSFGGYADAEMLLVDIATNTTLSDGYVESWVADPRIRADATTLLANGATSVSDKEAVAALFSGPDRAAAELAIASFSPEFRAVLAGISPITFADRIRTPVYLLHGKPDTAIPVAHAQLLAARLGDRVARFTEFGETGHSQPGQGGIGLEDVGDIAGLYLYLRDIVAAALE